MKLIPCSISRAGLYIKVKYFNCLNQAHFPLQHKDTTDTSCEIEKKSLIGLSESSKIADAS
jgi:hypothetical protein